MRIGVDEYFLDRRTPGLMRKDHINQRAIKRHQTLRQRHFRISANLPIGDMAQPIALRRDYAPAGSAKAGIKTKDDQPNFSMISSLIS